MLSLAFTFPAGRYHATPWDRHVNEGAVPWPPEPWRVLRALIATWHHKVKHSGRHAESTLERLIESLADDVPEYTLPPASHSHTRHYMPQWKQGDTSLVFDAFAAVAPDEPLHMTWRHLELADDEIALLDDLLEVAGYLGRAESWVEATRTSVAPPANCVPGERSYDPGTGEVLGEIVTLFAPMPSSEYQALRQRFVTESRVGQKLASTLPGTLVGALSVETSTLRKHGWSQPPAVRKVSYLRPLDALLPKRVSRPEPVPAFDTVQYVLVGRPLPRMEDTLRIGELLRQAIMSQARDEFGADAVPSVFSGHGMPENNRHGHAFYLPWDRDGDGRIDRLLLHVPSGLDPSARRVVERLRRIWSRGGGEWRVALEGIGDSSVGHRLTAPARVWESVTPYLHPWHVKKQFAIEDQIRRECRERGLPEVASLERLPSVRVGNMDRRPIDFHRFRSRRGLSQPDRHGSFWRLRFAEPPSGPLALGFACHFGLGLFRPAPSPGKTQCLSEIR
jgi:CRISPR-associated protein Csb2